MFQGAANVIHSHCVKNKLFLGLGMLRQQEFPCKRKSNKLTSKGGSDLVTMNLC